MLFSHNIISLSFRTYPLMPTLIIWVQL